MRHTLAALAIAVLAGPGAAVVPAANPAEETAAAGLLGTVHGPQGEPLGGVAVYAKGVDRTITTTVFTDARGEYVFPALEPGPYRLWAQAVGFEASRAAATLRAAERTVHAFALRAIADVAPQLSEAEWMAALPVRTKTQRRMKEILRVNCAMCHSIASILQHRHDEPGWLALVDQMARYNRANRRPTVEFHKAELARYLAAVRGPDSPPLTPAILPRPAGEAARVVFTQYDIPLANTPDGLVVLDGNDWSEGRATHRGYLNHDVAVAADGNVWLTAFPPPDRTLYRIDVATGQVAWYAVAGADGQGTRSSHGIVVDAAGLIYFTAGNALGRVDPETDTFEFFTPPPGMASIVAQDLDIAPDGAIWATTRGGAFRFDPAGRTWRRYGSVNPFDGATYGVAADADGNGWWTQFNANRLGKADPRTGEIFEVLLRPPWMQEREDTRTPADAAFYRSIGALAEGGDGGINMIPGALAPRRMGADRHGEFIYVANFNGESIARIDTRTLATKFYRLPTESHPYRVAVDRHRNAWVSMMGDDWLLKLDARTGEWSRYQLPVLNCDNRYVVSDHGRDEIWIPCARTSQAIRMRFRTPEQVRALREDRLPPLPRVAAAVPRPAGVLPKAASADPTVTRGVYDMRTVVQPPDLTAEERAGRKLFYGRCSMCHTRPSGPWIDQTTVRSKGRAFVRGKIAEGSAGMPGQQHSLSPRQIDWIVAYLETRTPAERPTGVPGWW